jgi:tetratricopeptide (TPR) repeat protein
MAGGTADYEKAAAALNAAAQVYAGEAGSDEWASIQHNLASTEMSIAERAPPALAAATIDKAIARYTTVITSSRERDDARSWASAQNDRALAFTARGERASDARQALIDVRRATAGFRAALRVHKLETVPQLYAASQTNLGHSLLDEGMLARDSKLIDQSIAAFDEALRVYTPNSYPRDWAEAASGLGDAFAALGELTGKPRLLRRAGDQYDKVLKQRSRSASPWQWARVENSRGTALWALGKLEGDRRILNEAANAFEGARAAFAESGDRHGASIAERNLAGVRKAAQGGR